MKFIGRLAKSSFSSLVNALLYFITILVGYGFYKAGIDALKILIFTGLGWLCSEAISASLLKQRKKAMFDLTVKLDKHEACSQNLENLNSAVIDLIQECGKSSVGLDDSIQEVKKNLNDELHNIDSLQKIVESNLEAIYLGKQTIDELVSAMNDIGESNSTLTTDIEIINTEFADILSVIREISEKTKMINEIVFQTKLLSFNASVEAARAGENGKGFAVVAEEIGNLARMSGITAQEITSILEYGSKKVREITQKSRERGQILVDRSTDCITAGTQIAKRSETAYEGLIRSGLQTNQMSLDHWETLKNWAHNFEKVCEAAQPKDFSTQKDNIVDELEKLKQDLAV